MATKPPTTETTASLRAERDDARRELAVLRKDVLRITTTLAGVTDKMDQMFQMLRRREAQLKSLERENRKLRRALGLDDPDPKRPIGAPGSDPAPAEPPLTEKTANATKGTKASVEAAAEPEAEGGPDSPTNGADVEPGETTPPNKSAESASARPKGVKDPGKFKARGRQGRTHGGRGAPPAHLDGVEELHGLCTCPHCRSRTVKHDTLVTRVYTVVPSYVRVRTIRRARGRCTNPDCQVVSVATMPPMPCERALYDCAFLAWLVVMKFALLVPLDRIRTHLASQGVNVSEGTLVHLIARAASLADPIDGEHMRQLKAGTWMAFDGTGLKTLIPGQSKAWDAYLEVYTRDELTVFQFDLTKHADRLNRRLVGFQGILLCDAETRNRAGFRGGTFANCNAHPRRALLAAEVAHPKLAAQGGRFIGALYDIEDEAEARGLQGARLVAYRRRRSGRILRRFRQWLDGVIRKQLPPSDHVLRVAK
jgi:transposase